MISRESCYSVNPSYLEANQPHLHPYMRAIVLDWMMEVCNEFGLRRETFHMSVNFVDRHLSRVSLVSDEEL